MKNKTFMKKKFFIVVMIGFLLILLIFLLFVVILSFRKDYVCFEEDGVSFIAHNPKIEIQNHDSEEGIKDVDGNIRYTSAMIGKI